MLREKEDLMNTKRVKRIRIKMKWMIGEEHHAYGRVVACGVREGEPYRMFSKDGDISLIPLDCLN